MKNLLFTALLCLFFAACGTLPKDIMPAASLEENLPQAAPPAEPIVEEEPLPEDAPPLFDENTPEIVLRAEEILLPFDAVVGDLLEPVYVFAAEPPKKEDAPSETAAAEEPAAPQVEPEPAAPPQTAAAPAPSPPPKETPPPPPAPPPPPPEPPRTVRPAQPAPPPPKETPPPQAAALPARIHPTETEPKEKNLFSRTVRAVAGQIVEIPFRGTGWVFLGEEKSQRGMAYDSRRLDDEGQTFIFRAESPGVYDLKFSKQDFVNNTYLNDNVEVITGANHGENQISRATGERMRIVAEPRWPPAGNGAAHSAGKFIAAPPAASLPAEAPPFAAENPAPSEADVEEAADGRGAPPKIDFMEQARANFAAGKFAGVVEALDRLHDENPLVNDEAWWLYGQSFEANSPIRDIKSAINAYQHITRDFPQSKYYQDARARIAYLNKFYLNIR